MEDGCEKEIEKQLRKRGLTKDKDVSEIYLAIRGLEEVNDFGRFKNLQVLWLNGNKVGTRSGDVHLRSQNSLAWLV
ncbi:leucine-rich repeat-containing protein 72-like [Montipora capricornis]|uniref:leucine-rich repeat-containing protein 72-like n=1 Tax=Montipora capricornis TaxID=246305 RepID=UPI0035F1DEBB